MPLLREEIEQIAKSSAQAVLEGLHRYSVDYKEPETIEQGLQDSMIEERTAADWYRKRAEHATVQGERDQRTSALYEHIATEEDRHYDEFKARLQELGKAVDFRNLAERLISKAASDSDFATMNQIANEKAALAAEREYPDRAKEAKNWLLKKASEMGIPATTGNPHNPEKTQPCPKCGKPLILRFISKVGYSAWIHEYPMGKVLAGEKFCDYSEKA